MPLGQDGPVAPERERAAVVQSVAALEEPVVQSEAVHAPRQEVVVEKRSAV